MTEAILLDAGPLVATLSNRDRAHGWAAEQFARLRPRLLTCEAVITEACFLLQSVPQGPRAVMEMLANGFIALRFDLGRAVFPVKTLIAKYADLPMSLADACLVRMSEQIAESVVFTLDSHFRIYRKHGRQVIPTLMPRGK